MQTGLRFAPLEAVADLLATRRRAVEVLVSGDVNAFVALKIQDKRGRRRLTILRGPGKRGQSRMQVYQKARSRDLDAIPGCRLPKFGLVRSVASRNRDDCAAR